MSTVTEFATPEEFFVEFNNLTQTGEFFIVYLTGGVTDGKSWCPDCEKFGPLIEEHVLAKTSLRVLKGIVAERGSWVGVADHPYKAHPIIKANGVPQLCLIQGEVNLVKTNDDADFENVQLLESIARPEE